MNAALVALLIATAPAMPVGQEGQAPAAAPAQEPATVEVVEETEIDRQVREVASKLRCVVCQGLSLQDSPSDLAQEMRAVIRTRLESGETPEEVMAYFESGYGEWILMEPKAEGFNLAVYLLPILAVVGGGVFLVLAGRRWLSASRSAKPEPKVDETDPDLAAWDDLVRR
jgi:cytochrome c-type biogenesis protein CcmH